MFAKLTKFLAPAPPQPLRSESEINRLYPLYRWRILASTFTGYALFYLVRNNIGVVAKDIGAALSYDKIMMGNILAVSAITYGVGKLCMGAVSDRSDSRKFMALGLLLTALCNFAFGASQTYSVHLLLWALNGFIQGMGWGPCGRSLGHWFSVTERGTVFAWWNISHNVGGGIAGIIAAWATARYSWQSAFFIPGIIAVIGAVVMYASLIDTPESVGLPSIEAYKKVGHTKHQNPLTVYSFKEILVTHVLKNRMLWLVAIANFFVYIARYSMLDWGPTYLREVKGATLQDGGWAVSIIEFGGIPSTILVGWFSDRLQGRRGMVSLLCMVPVLAAFCGLIINPPGHLAIDNALLLVVGFFVYPPVMLLGVMALDLAGKKAVGAAAGFVGLFGYLGRTFQAKLFGWLSQTFGTTMGWDYVLYAIIMCAALAIIFLIPTWKARPQD
jgi:OPA family glycerol-3-phosphate transporter-like MFS transporter